MKDKLFIVNQEITPIHNSGPYKKRMMFGKVFRVSEYKFENNHWYIGLREFPPQILGHQMFIDWWPQESFSEVCPLESLNKLLLEIELVNGVASKVQWPVIICPDKVGGLGL